MSYLNHFKLAMKSLKVSDSSSHCSALNNVGATLQGHREQRWRPRFRHTGTEDNEMVDGCIKKAAKKANIMGATYSKPEIKSIAR